MTTNNSCDQNQVGYQSKTAGGVFNGRSIVAGNSSITVTNGDGTAGNTSIVANIPGSALTWNYITGATQTAVAGNGYATDNAGTCVITLPATSAFGDQIGVMGMNNATGWKIAQNAGNQIILGSSATTVGVGGYIQSTAITDTIILMCTVANTKWQCFPPQGNIQVV